jgi:hypothetical protein
MNPHKTQNFLEEMQALVYLWKSVIMNKYRSKELVNFYSQILHVIPLDKELRCHLCTHEKWFLFLVIYWNRGAHNYMLISYDS